jgi:anaerobic selenocysteine-containing dehydrogenase
MTMQRRAFLKSSAAGAAAVGLTLLGTGPGHATTAGTQATAPANIFARNFGSGELDHAINRPISGWTKVSIPVST